MSGEEKKGQMVPSPPPYEPTARLIRAPLQKNTVEPYALIGWQGWQD